MPSPRQVAIYARVSTADQNPDTQLTVLRDYAMRRGFIIYKEYIDWVTGDIMKRRRRRKPPARAYDALMHDVNRRVVDCVLVWKYDRFARSLSVLVSALQHFQTLGIGQKYAPDFMRIRERRGNSTWASDRQKGFSCFV